MRRIRIGNRNKSVTFYSPKSGNNTSGGTEDGWTEMFSALAHFLPLRGSEITLAARQVGKKPVIVTIAASPDHLLIKADWKMVCDGKEYNIKEDPTETEDFNDVQFLAEGGVSVGDSG